MKEISVKTDYDIETSPPSPSPDDSGLMYTMKKTLVTTTKEVTTNIRQEIKTQLEVVHVDNETELPRRIGMLSLILIFYTMPSILAVFFFLF